MTWLTRRFGIDHPIVSAPMTGRSGGRLAAAVSEAGGLGLIGAGRSVTPDWIDEQAGTAAATGCPFGIGLMTWALPDTPDLLTATLDARPALVSLSFGDPAPYIDSVRDAGAVAAMQVNSVADLRVAERAGVDLVVAQGTDAGGHTGHIGTLPLLQDVLESTGLPVLAAGGIATGRGLAAVLAAGAAGAWIGTAFLACPETDGPSGARERILAADGSDTVYTTVVDRALGVPWPERWGTRVLRNAFTDRWHGQEREVDAEARTALESARAAGDFDIADIDAGQAVGLVLESRPAGEVVRTIADDAAARLAK